MGSGRMKEEDVESGKRSLPILCLPWITFHFVPARAFKDVRVISPEIVYCSEELNGKRQAECLA